MNNTKRYINLFSGAVLLFLGFISLVVGWINPSLGETGLGLFVLFYCCGFVPLGWLSAIWLIWTGRERLSKTAVWLVFQLVFMVSIYLYASPSFGLFFSSLLILLTPLLGFVDLMYAYQNGFSIRMIAMGSVAFIWAILLAWRVNGNLFDEWIATLSTGSNDLWWLNGLMCVFGWIVVAGAIAFIREIYSVVSKEHAAQ